MITRTLQSTGFRLRWNPIPIRNFAHRFRYSLIQMVSFIFVFHTIFLSRRYFADQPFEKIPKDDPIRDPFRAYRDPRYYTKVMQESNTQGANYREIFDIAL